MSVISASADSLPQDDIPVDNTVIEKRSKLIEVENIKQYPELPTGCESVALTILLNHLGYKADKMDIVRNYLPKMDFYWD